MPKLNEMASGWVLTLVFAVVAMTVLYRRARRLFGRQELRRSRLLARLGLLGGACTLLLVVVWRGQGPVPALLGLVLGAGIALLALVYTRFDSNEGRVHYTPNAYIGIGVLSLFVGRMAYRLIRIGDVTEADPGAARAGPGGLSSPVTAVVLFVLLGYYICYYTALVRRGRARESDSA